MKKSGRGSSASNGAVKSDGLKRRLARAESASALAQDLLKTERERSADLDAELKKALLQKQKLEGRLQRLSGRHEEVVQQNEGLVSRVVQEQRKHKEYVALSALNTTILLQKVDELNRAFGDLHSRVQQQEQELEQLRRQAEG